MHKEGKDDKNPVYRSYYVLAYKDLRDPVRNRFFSSITFSDLIYHAALTLYLV